MGIKAIWYALKPKLLYAAIACIFCMAILTTALTGNAETVSPLPSETITIIPKPSDGTETSRNDIIIIPEAPAEQETVYVGEMEITAYSGDSGSITFSGSPPQEGHTIAAKLGVFQIGDTLKINDHIYYVEDKVSPEASEQLRIYFDSQDDALAYGRHNYPVYKINTYIEEPDSYLGDFDVTGYCSCSICCGEKAVSLTKSETVPRSMHTIAADPDVLPMGTRVVIDGVTYTMEDIGMAIKGNMIDIYFDTHEEALNYGRQKKKVYLAE